MNQRTDSTALLVGRRPQLAYWIATVFGLGYLPVGPGTWGSAGGVVLYALTQFYLPLDAPPAVRPGLGNRAVWLGWTAVPIAAVVAIAGVWAANRVTAFSGKTDPPFIVIDEVSGQYLTYLFALAPTNWKYLLVGFILFRGFDIWKPFPARQVESLRGGWGIMADDWVAGVYAALALWLARGLGL
jgi:phosphatidylglycerophosphatase A